MLQPLLKLWNSQVASQFFLSASEARKQLTTTCIIKVARSGFPKMQNLLTRCKVRVIRRRCGRRGAIASHQMFHDCDPFDPDDVGIFNQRNEIGWITAGNAEMCSAASMSTAAHNTAARSLPGASLP